MAFRIGSCAPKTTLVVSVSFFPVHFSICLHVLTEIFILRPLFTDSGTRSRQLIPLVPDSDSTLKAFTSERYIILHKSPLEKLENELGWILSPFFFHFDFICHHFWLRWISAHTHILARTWWWKKSRTALWAQRRTRLHFSSFNALTQGSTMPFHPQGNWRYASPQAKQSPSKMPGKLSGRGWKLFWSSDKLHCKRKVTSLKIQGGILNLSCSTFRRLMPVRSKRHWLVGLRCKQETRRVT